MVSLLCEGNEEKRRTEGKPGGRPSVRDTIFGEDNEGHKPTGEEAEFLRHASVKLTSFLDKVIEVEGTNLFSLSKWRKLKLM